MEHEYTTKAVVIVELKHMGGPKGALKSIQDLLDHLPVENSKILSIASNFVRNAPPSAEFKDVKF